MSNYRQSHVARRPRTIAFVLAVVAAVVATLLSPEVALAATEELFGAYY